MAIPASSNPDITINYHWRFFFLTSSVHSFLSIRIAFGTSFDQFQSNQTNKVVKMMGAWYEATALHQVVAAWTSMGIVPILGAKGQKYVQVDRARARAVLAWGMETPANPFGSAGLHRIRLHTA
jgi:hypothetical protein